jgi:hypothetical protein
MSKIDSALERAARQWRDDVDTAYIAVARRQSRPPHRGKNWVWGGFATAAAVVVAAVVWVTSGGGDSQHRPPSQLDCAGPVLQVTGAQQPLPVRPGQKVTVRGKYYVTGCQDSVSKAEPEPIASVRLTLTEPDGHQIVLATAHPAGELGTFSVTTRIPSDVPRGQATIGDGGISSGGVRLVVLS